MKIFSAGCFYAFLMLFLATSAFASGAYDHGTLVGKGNLELDFTLNPVGNKYDGAQSYIVWSYGLADKYDFHGYVSHGGDGSDQVYAGLMRSLYTSNTWDFSTAIGTRKVDGGKTHYFFPQLLYSYKWQNDYSVGGSIVNVGYKLTSESQGVTYDVTLFKSIYKRPSGRIKEIKLGVGIFKGLSYTLPSYSVDVLF